jgi:ubiquinone/menaquinone biosynthesis C-methylase UbiE
MKRLGALFEAGFEPANKVILDLGAGACAYSKVMKDMHASTVVSADINRRTLSQASGRLINRVICSASALPFRQCCFDCVLLIEVLEHLPDDKISLSESIRALKSDAYLLITVPNQFFILETHGIRIFSTEIENLFGIGIPFMSFLPKTLRKHIERARIYSVKALTRLLDEFNLQISSRNYMMPPLDKIERGEIKMRNVNASLAAAIRVILARIERTPLKMLGAHIIIVARKH